MVRTFPDQDPFMSVQTLGKATLTTIDGKVITGAGVL